jgi:hypothetical protein
MACFCPAWKFKPPRVAAISSPPHQQLGGGRRHALQQIGSAAFQASAQRVGGGAQADGEGEWVVCVGHGLWVSVGLSGKPWRWPQCLPAIVVKLERPTMSTGSMRIDESLVCAVRAAAKAEFRTVQGQVEFWARVGRAALENPDVPTSFIAESLMSLAEPREDSTPFAPRSRAAQA